MSVSKSSSSTKTSDCANSATDDLETLNSPCLNLSDMPSLKSLNSLQQNSKKMKENEKTCCVCSEPSFLHSCSIPDCKNDFHRFCISSYFPELEEKSVCPAHSCKQLETLKKRLHLANHFNSSNSIQKIVKDEKESKHQPDLKGKLFWFGINQQYFPYFNGNKPELLQDEMKTLQQDDTSCWIQQKIEEVSLKLSAVSNSNESLFNFSQIHQNFSNFLEKPGLHLTEAGNLQHDFQEDFRKNSEILLRVPEKTELKDYHSWQADDKIICAVCDDGESTFDNLIVICSLCNLAVHCGCYNIVEVPELDWHCDVCALRATGVNCVLCPVPGGALKLAKPNKWVHVSCARYLLTTNLYTFNWDTRNIDRDKLRLTCNSCGKQYGACVQCNFSRCSISFHVECRKDLIEYEQDSVYWLCPQHKIKKLWRKVKTERELGTRYIEKISEALWKEKTQEAKPLGRPSQKQPSNRKLILCITPEQMLLKLMIGTKVLNETRYLAEIVEGRKRRRDEETFIEICQVDSEVKENFENEKIDKEKVKIEKERKRVEKERKRVEKERKRMEKEKRKAEKEKARIEKERLRNEKEKIKTPQESLTVEKEKEPFYIFKSSKPKKTEESELKKEKRKYKPRKPKNLENDENLNKNLQNTEINETVANNTLPDPSNLSLNLKPEELPDEENIEQFFFQETPEIPPAKPETPVVKRGRKRKENTEKSKKPRKEKHPDEKKPKVPRKPKKVITASRSLKGELWVKLHVPQEIFDQVCKKKRKV
jgi:hypothetical protein